MWVVKMQLINIKCIFLLGRLDYTECIDESNDILASPKYKQRKKTIGKENQTMRKKIILLILCLSLPLFLNAIEPHFMKDPAISPDGSTICFSYMSDLWLVPFEGGEAKRLTDIEGYDSGPVFSPDGTKIAFNSTRDGYTNIYVIPATGGKAECISKETGIQVCDWFSDNRILATRYGIELGSNFCILSLDGSRPIELTPIGEYFSSLSPDNTKIVYSYRGDPFREKYTGSTNGELWEYNIETGDYTRLTRTDYTERYPVYSHIHENRIYFGASDGTVFQLYYVDDYNFDEKNQLTDFDLWSVRDISIARQNDRIVFEKFDEIWRYEPVDGSVQKVQIDIKQDYIEDFVVKGTYYNSATHYAVSPDGSFIAFAHKFDLFVMPEKGGEVKQVTHNQEGFGGIEIMPDNKTIFFMQYEKGKPGLYKTVITNIENIEKVHWFDDKFVQWIEHGYEDNLLVMYKEGEKSNRIAMVNSKTNKVTPIIEDKIVNSNFAWGPDGRYGLYCSIRDDAPGQDLLYLYDFEEKTSTLILPYYGSMNNPLWGLYGKFAFFNMKGDIYRIDLQAKKDFWDEVDNWEPILRPESSSQEKKEDKDNKGKAEKDKEPTPINIDLQNIEKRITELVSRPGYNYLIATVPDSLIYYLNVYTPPDGGTSYTLRKVKYDGESDEVCRTFSSYPEDIQYNKGNQCFYYIENNTLYKLTTDGESKIVENKFRYEYDKLLLNKIIFDQAWQFFGIGFYDPDMHGVDWQEMYNRFLPYMDFAYTPDIMGDIVSEMIGEVNASHTGFYPRKDKHVKSYQQAYGGFTLDYTDLPEKGIRFKKIFNKSKLNKPYGIKPGDVLLAVDGVEITPKTHVSSLFIDKVGEKIVLTIETADSIVTAELLGLSYQEHYNMWYDNWVDERREYVEEFSDGRIGYAHIRQMGRNSYEKFMQDLLALNYDKDAIIIDIRNNPGGWSHDLLLELLTKKHYAYQAPRWLGAKKVKTPVAWEKPMALIINENSFSDAEIFPILFKQFDLGPLIGTPTSGSVIATGHIEFMDGSSMRMPGTGWYTLGGANMEGTGAEPDILVEPTPEQLIADDDVQLRKAVEELQKELENTDNE